jgi:hypothetical protein
MNTRANKPLKLRLLGAGIAAILVGGIAIASLAISGQGISDDSAPAEPPVAAASSPGAAPAPRAYRCSECGVIESAPKIDVSGEQAGFDSSGPIAPGKRGEIEATPLRNYEITIRLRDGSMRVIRDAKPAIWKHGEAVIIIAGGDR